MKLSRLGWSKKYNPLIQDNRPLHNARSQLNVRHKFHASSLYFFQSRLIFRTGLFPRLRTDLFFYFWFVISRLYFSFLEVIVWGRIVWIFSVNFQSLTRFIESKIERVRINGGIREKNSHVKENMNSYFFFLILRSNFFIPSIFSFEITFLSLTLQFVFPQRQYCTNGT